MAEGMNLLQKLGSGLRPAGPELPARSIAASGSSSLNFSELLGQAQRGEIASGLPVQIGKGAGVELSADQLARAAIAADRAQAAGADRAVLMIDGMALKLDVATRTISGNAELTPGAALADIDAVVVAPEASSEAAAARQAAAQLSASTPANASLLEALAAPRRADADR